MIMNITMFNYRYVSAIIGIFVAFVQVNAQNTAFHPGKLWFDNNQRIINAHGGGVLYHDGQYYWFGEHKGERSNAAWVGVTCYSSSDLYNWNDEGVALAVSKDNRSPKIGRASWREGG